MPEVTAPAGVNGLRETYRTLEQSLGAPEAVARRDALKAEIIALFRAVDREIGELTQLKDDVRGLVERWKAIEGGSGVVGAPPAVQPAELPTRTDHLNASSFVEKGWSLISLGDYEAAEAALVRALQLVPNDPHSEALLGWAQMLQEKYDEALLHFQHVLMREPNNALARVNVGYICLKKGIFGEAIEHLSKAIRLDNDRKATLYAHYYLGLLYFEREMFEDAELFLRKTIALGPSLVEAYYQLGRARWFAGDRKGGAQAWREGVQANKFNPWGKRCADILQHVEAGGEPPRSG
jgi:tetratricopeptide (TPR) repeat protein